MLFTKLANCLLHTKKNICLNAMLNWTLQRWRAKDGLTGEILYVPVSHLKVGKGARFKRSENNVRHLGPSNRFQKIFGGVVNKGLCACSHIIQ